MAALQGFPATPLIFAVKKMDWGWIDRGHLWLAMNESIAGPGKKLSQAVETAEEKKKLKSLGDGDRRAASDA